MKNYEFYIKYKISHHTIINPAFYTRNWWQIILPMLTAVLIGPLVIYKISKVRSFLLYLLLSAPGVLLPDCCSFYFISSLAYLAGANKPKQRLQLGWKI